MNIRQYLSWRTLVFACWCALAVVMVLSLLSWSYQDPSFLHSASKQLAISNLLGVVGATVSATLFFIAGIASLFIPFVLVYSAWVWYSHQWRTEWDRVIGMVSSILCVAAFASWSRDGFFKHVLVQGGVIGTGLVRLYALCLPPALLGFFLVGLLYCSLIVATRMAVVRWSAYVVSMAARVSFVVSRAIVRSTWYTTVASYRWLVDMVSGAHLSRLELLLDDEERQELELFGDLRADPFWQQFTTPTASEQVVQQDLVEPAVACSSLYVVPDLASMQPESKPDSVAQTDMSQMSTQLMQKLTYLGVQGTIRSVKHGPVVTLFAFEPAPDSKLSKIVGLEDDIALALSAHSVRIIAPIPGTAYVGIEVANKQRSTVYFLELVRSKLYQQTSAALPLMLGVETAGAPVLVDLASLPHLLVAGSTGSGKSVALTTMLVSLLGTQTPEKMRLVLIDPKRLEFSGFADIPHLMFPIVTQPAQAIAVLRWLVGHMDERYELMAEHGVKNISDYNALGIEPLARIVVVIDELADLMMTAGKQVEDALARLAQMSRAAGIHLIVATQRPSVDVITGLIKVNFPSRIAFRVTSKVDSRTIIDECGAEKLLGKGDMLLMDATGIKRVHGCYLSDDALRTIIAACKKQSRPSYVSLESVMAASAVDDLADDAELYSQVEAFINELDEVSISLVQRKFRIGYNRSARIIELLQQRGRISAADGSKMKKVIKTSVAEK